MIASALPADQAVSAPGDAFPEIWAAMTDWDDANFLIMKGANVFEINSPIAPGKPSTRSSYYNIDYIHPLRGHLWPDLYTSIYAVRQPTEGEGVIRGVLFHSGEDGLIFGAFISGEDLAVSESELAKFDRVCARVESKPSVCGGS